MVMAVGFKEWLVVCEALGRGVQDVIIRKGGIHEGSGGFEFIHEQFYLFPTLFHKQSGLVKESVRGWIPQDNRKIWDLGEIVQVKYRCTVEKTELLTDWDEVVTLNNRHIYSEQLIRERFDWQGKGMKAGCVNVAYVKTEILTKPLEVSYAKTHGGCRSWIQV